MSRHLVVLTGVALLGGLAGLPAQDRENKTLIPIFDKVEGSERGVWTIGPGFEASFHDGYVFYTGGHAAAKPWRYRLESVRIGREELPLHDSRPHKEPFRFSYDHGSVIERYDLRERGIEQSFVIAKDPRPRERRTRGDLVITGRVESSLQATPIAARHGALEFRSTNAKVTLRYGEAIAFDAAGRRTVVETSWDGQRLRLHLAAPWLEGAKWPVTVDPLTSSKEVYRLPASTPGGWISHVDIARESLSHSHNLMIAFSTATFPSYPMANGLLLCNDDYTGAMLIRQSTIQTGSSPKVAAVYGAKRWVCAIGTDIYIHDFANTTMNSGTTITTLGIHDAHIDVGGCLSGNNAMLVYLQVGTGLNVVTVDAAQRTLGTARNVVPLFIGLPRITPLRSGSSSSWIVMWSQDQQTRIARVNESTVTNPASLGSSNYLYGCVAGMDGQ